MGLIPLLELHVNYPYFDSLFTRTRISIPFGDPSEFVITGSNKVEHHLRADNSSADISCLRDTIVLTLRLFVIRAGERRKGKRRVLFFHK
ncbi:hypothetical protein SDJN02_02096, partial [Cucurbita argyrosperma subsp. argyrosperma]